MGGVHRERGKMGGGGKVGRGTEFTVQREKQLREVETTEVLW